MIKKINTKTIKLIKFYNFINYNLIYNNTAINRYKKNTFEISGNKAEKLEKLKIYQYQLKFEKYQLQEFPYSKLIKIFQKNYLLYP